jgi:hypothetical protein
MLQINTSPDAVSPVHTAAAIPPVCTILAGAHVASARERHVCASAVGVGVLLTRVACATINVYICNNIKQKQ